MTVTTRSSVRWLTALTCLVVVSLLSAAVAFVKGYQVQAGQLADRKASNTSRVAQCYQQVENGPAVTKILGLIDDLATNSIIANRELLKTSPGNDPLRKIRQDSLNRLVPAREQLRIFIARTVAQAPTTKQCRGLAASLHVDYRPLERSQP